MLISPESGLKLARAVWRIAFSENYNALWTEVTYEMTCGWKEMIGISPCELQASQPDIDWKEEGYSWCWHHQQIKERPLPSFTVM